ncbi:HAD family hydrolase [Streptomyces kaniharaensis]|uniref:HAD family hydrolase n=1 Tax=Streptomyces kaniharaensis TaxID=212423 RepID=UPI001297969A|nr:HAD family hydrolase [Streptomyces kaniharaensis]
MTVVSAALFGTDWRPALPGTAELLRECAARGWTVVLIGQGPVGAPALTVTAPGSDPVRAALHLVDGTAEHAVYVAASVREVLAARRAGVPCLALETGRDTGVELRAAGAAEVHRDPAALLRVLDDSLLARPRAFGPVGAGSGRPGGG